MNKFLSGGDVFTPGQKRNDQVQQYHAAVQAHRPSEASQLKESIRLDVQAEHRNSPDLVKGIAHHGRGVGSR